MKAFKFRNSDADGDEKKELLECGPEIENENPNIQLDDATSSREPVEMFSQNVCR